MTRPSETVQGIVGSIFGAALIVVGALKGGFAFDRLAAPEVAGSIVLLISWVASGVTWFVARKQAQGDLSSGPEGQVQ